MMEANPSSQNASADGVAYFVRARTEPVESGPDHHGRGTAVILRGAPSRAAAEEWAARHAHALLLAERPDQRLNSLLILPLDPQLVTDEGRAPIEWEKIKRSREGQAAQERWRRERGSSARISAPNSGPEAGAPLDVEAFMKAIPCAAELNWDEAIFSYYVFFHETKAFVVRGVNRFLATRPYRKAIRGTPDGDSPANIRAWPGTAEYTAPGPTG